jgi:hypothetical protein
MNVSRIYDGDDELVEMKIELKKRPPTEVASI